MIQLTTKEKKQYSVGDVVWAQTYQEPIWPATIEKIIDDDRYRVYFLNDPTQAILSSEDL